MIGFCAWAAAAGCVANVDGSAPEPPVPQESFGVVAQPRLGTVVQGQTATASLTVAGVHTRADYAIAVQIFTDDWITIATTTTGNAPSSTDASVFEWQVIVAPAQFSPSRWPQGGL